MNINDANAPAWGQPRYFVAKTPRTGLGPAMSDTIVGRMALAVEQAWGIAPVLTAGTALGVAAAAGCGRYSIVKDYFAEFPLALNAAMLSDPGTLKSSLLGALTRELKTLQADKAAEMNAEISGRIREADALTQALEKVKRDMATAYAKGADTTDLQAHAEGLSMQLEKVRAHEFTAPFRPISFGSDSTPEAIVKRAATQGGRVALLSAEAGVLENLAGRYSDGNAKTEFLNSAFDGEPYEGSRVSDDGRDIPNPWATLVLAIQPDALNTMLDNKVMRTRGFLQRWLLFHAPRGKYRPRMSMPTLDATAQDLWDRRIADIWGAAGWGQGVHTLPLPDDVKKLIEEFEVDRVAIAYARAEDEGNALFMGWLGKIAMTTARVAGILTLLEGAFAADEVSLPATEAAVELAHVALDHADYLFAHGPSAITRSPRYRVLEALVQGSVGFVSADQDADDDGTSSVGFVRVEDGTFTRRGVHRRFQDQTWCRTSEDVEAVLLDLAADGWVQRLPKKRDGERPSGRPPELWALHPEAVDHFNAMTGTKEEH